MIQHNPSHRKLKPQYNPSTLVHFQYRYCMVVSSTPSFGGKQCSGRRRRRKDDFAVEAGKPNVLQHSTSIQNSLPIEPCHKHELLHSQEFRSTRRSHTSGKGCKTAHTVSYKEVSLAHDSEINKRIIAVVVLWCPQVIKGIL